MLDNDIIVHVYKVDVSAASQWKPLGLSLPRLYVKISKKVLGRLFKCTPLRSSNRLFDSFYLHGLNLLLLLLRECSGKCVLSTLGSLGGNLIHDFLVFSLMGLDMNVLSEIFQTGRNLSTIIKLISDKAEERGSFFTLRLTPGLWELINRWVFFSFWNQQSFRIQLRHPEHLG